MSSYCTLSETFALKNLKGLKSSVIIDVVTQKAFHIDLRSTFTQSTSILELLLRLSP